MKKASTIISILLGITLIIFGLNKFFNFMPVMELSAPGLEFMGAFIKVGYGMTIVAIIEIITGILIATNKFRALALVILFPILLNALLFHMFLDPENILPAVLVVGMNLFLMYSSREKYGPLFQA
ncbi:MULTISPECIES: DoxX protein [Flavobacteriaceae]|uniref:DoxX protein n=2 Tax=Flavobacteriaceae TaxID=49546 RepID=A0A4Y8AVT5_9FLAO|nr:MULTISPECIES: DoxX protein [Flavobacteriaceae]TEW76637.1 DoxX protein [Gramella jeungdoensis]